MVILPEFQTNWFKILDLLYFEANVIFFVTGSIRLVGKIWVHFSYFLQAHDVTYLDIYVTMTSQYILGIP